MRDFWLKRANIIRRSVSLRSFSYVEVLPTNRIFLARDLVEVRTRVKKPSVTTTAPALFIA